MDIRHSPSALRFTDATHSGAPTCHHYRRVHSGRSEAQPRSPGIFYTVRHSMIVSELGAPCLPLLRPRARRTYQLQPIDNSARILFPAADHGGGYAYRLCPAGEPLTEACFRTGYWHSSSHQLPGRRRALAMESPGVQRLGSGTQPSSSDGFPAGGSVAGSSDCLGWMVYISARSKT